MRVIDNFLSTYEEYKRYVRNTKFKTKTFGGKDFVIADVPMHLQKTIYDKIQRIFAMSGDFVPTLCYFRKSSPSIDTDVRIHTDQNHCDFVSVLYMSEDMNNLSGTAFWDHPTYGKQLPFDAKDKVIDNIIEYEGKDESLWKLNTVIGARQNRCVTYPSNFFHSRYPFKSKHTRLVGTFFWSISQNRKTHTP